jgi:hypothetical protein
VKVEDERGGEGWRRWNEERGETNKNPAEEIISVQYHRQKDVFLNI